MLKEYPSCWTFGLSGLCELNIIIFYFFYKFYSWLVYCNGKPMQNSWIWYYFLFLILMPFFSLACAFLYLLLQGIETPNTWRVSVTFNYLGLTNALVQIMWVAECFMLLKATLSFCVFIVVVGGMSFPSAWDKVYQYGHFVL